MYSLRWAVSIALKGFFFTILVLHSERSFSQQGLTQGDFDVFKCRELHETTLVDFVIKPGVRDYQKAKEELRHASQWYADECKKYVGGGEATQSRQTMSLIEGMSNSALKKKSEVDTQAQRLAKSLRDLSGAAKTLLMDQCAREAWRSATILENGQDSDVKSSADQLSLCKLPGK